MSPTAKPSSSEDTTVPVLTSQQRKTLEDACTKGRRASEQAVRAALTSLSVAAERPLAPLNEEDRQLRRGLRAKARQLGDQGDNLDLLIAECAYEQWHRLLFARFLAENHLLIHPEYRAPVSLEDCEELAESLGEPDGWSVAARFAAEILPGIFRIDDPCVRLRLTPEGRLSVEDIVAGLPAATFACDDALGWVYQFWQKDKKDEVNDSGRKIAGADIGPVTQLFTETYMVRFLLENSLGAWWAARHPDSPLVKGFEYLRLRDDGEPAAGTFDDWPDRASEVTVMDPCCGSGHFLAEAFRMLWRMRAEEEQLAPGDAQDAVLRDNLFGLELDPRCVQIAMFAIALQAWTTGGGWRELPVPNVACSGVPVKASVDEWKALAGGDDRLEGALTRLHVLFREADSFGSLIDPRHSAEIIDPTGLQRSFEDVDWSEIEPLLARAVGNESIDPATAVLGTDATSIIRAARFLARSSWLVITNPPYLGRIKQSEKLRAFVERYYRHGRQDLATAFLQRMRALAEPGGATCVVIPQNWMVQPSYEALRVDYLRTQTLAVGAVLGEEAFESFGIRGPRVVLLVILNEPPRADSSTVAIDVSTPPGRDQVLIPEKQRRLATNELLEVPQKAFQNAPRSRITFTKHSGLLTLRTYAESYQGLKTGDDSRFRQYFWEQPRIGGDWREAQGSPDGGSEGLHFIVQWGSDGRHIARAQGLRAWGRMGIVVTRTRNILSAPYAGVPFFSEIAASN
jgi:hypothetical protein